MLSNKNIFSLLLLLLVVMTAAAEDNIKLRGCRRGTLNTAALSRRASSMPGLTRTASDNPYIGERHQLVVLAAFTDRGFAGDSIETVNKWDKIFNQKDYTVAPYVGSVRDYFYDQSYKLLNLSFEIEYVQLNDSCKKYRSTAKEDENSQFLVQDIVDVLEKRNINWGMYDWDGDNYVNQLLIIFAGKGSSYGGFGGGYDTIFPHQWWLTQHIDPVTKIYGKELTVVFEGNNLYVDKYCTIQELSTDDPEPRIAFGTICHEYTHCFGFPDFYDYYNNPYLFGWDLMDYGNYNGDGFCPPGYSAYERMLMGWIDLKELKDEVTVTNMAALSDEKEAYIIRNEAQENEFYVIENRQRIKWDEYLPNNGIVVFHIEYDKNVWDNDWPNTPQKQHYTIIPANNKSFSEYKKSGDYYNAMWAYPYNGNNQLTNTSTPAATLWNANTDGSYLMNKSITNMSVTNGKASFKFSPTPTAIREMKYNTQSQDVYYNLAGQRISGPQKGVYILNGKKYIK